MVNRKLKQFIVVAYDVANDKRRLKIAKMLEQYGLRCNESVFECILTEAKTREMKNKLLNVADESEDSILIYNLCMPCTVKRENIGKRAELLPETVVV